MMNTLLFDLSVCQPNAETKFHGGGVYGYIVFKRLCATAPQRIIAYYSFSRFLDPSVFNQIGENHITVVDSDEWTIEAAYRKYNVDIVYSPLYSIHHNGIIRLGVRFVVTIHGLRSLEMLSDKMETAYATNFMMWAKAKMKASLMRDGIYNRNYLRYGFLLSSPNVRVVTVSCHSKFSIKVYYPTVNLDSIKVFYSPSTTIANYKDFANKRTEKYYLIISANRWLKNAGRAIAALDLLFETFPNLCNTVKVLGLNRKTKIFKDIKHKDKFVFLGYQSQEDLEKLYAGAYAFIYPTLNEGFGYPPLEAMKYGTPVISSPFSSVPEICGDSVLYTNPYSIEEIANRVLQLEDIHCYNDISKRGLERYAMISEKQDKDLECLCRLLLEE